MFKRDNTNTTSNFWISYADLMAGLLFVFILLIGAIVSKAIILKTDLHEKENRLSMVSKTLEEKKEKLDNISAILAKSKALLGEKELYIAKTQEELRLKDEKIKLRDKNLKLKDEKIKLRDKKLKFKDDEIKKLNAMLLKANTREDRLNRQIVIVQNLLNDTKNVLKQKREELKAYEGKVIVLSNQLTDANRTVKLKDEKLLELLNALDEKKTKYDALVEKLQKQKAKIKSLTGIKLKVIAALKEELGENISIDKKSGSLRLASNILFDRGSAKLKPEAEMQLKKAFEEYVGTLISNEQIKPYLDKIIIEGHTDSDGGYLYNLELSQKRAFAVMNFLLTLDFAKEHNIKPLVIASGRAYLDAIKVNGVEDKEASRRIEIKFRLKNEDAMHEIEKVLDAQ